MKNVNLPQSCDHRGDGESVFGLSPDDLLSLLDQLGGQQALAVHDAQRVSGGRKLKTKKVIVRMR
jgi:hypothetical protein